MGAKTFSDFRVNFDCFFFLLCYIDTEIVLNSRFSKKLFWYFLEQCNIIYVRTLNFRTT